MAFLPSAKTSPRQERLLWSALVFAVALTARLWHLIQIRSAPFFPFRIGDAETYHAWAQDIAAGNWLGEGVFYQAPLYPYFLGSIYTLLGDDVMTVRKCQAVIGALSCVFLANAGWRFFSRGVGILAGMMLALYAPAIFFDGLIQKSVLDLFFLCLALWILSELVQEPTGWGWFSFGLCLGAFTLTRENAAVLIVPTGVWIFLERAAHPSPTRFRRLALTTGLLAGVAVVLLPVAARNKIVGGEFHLTTSQLGPNLYIGNNPRADGTYRPLEFGHGHANLERNDATRLAEQAEGRELSPSQVSAHYVRASLDYIAAQPVDWLCLMLRKLALTWNCIELTDSEDMYTHADWSWPLRSGAVLVHFGVLAPLATYGLFCTWSERHRLWLLYLMALFFTASVAIFFVFARYRFPLVPLLILFAAAGLCATWQLGRNREPRFAPLAMAAVLVMALVSNWPLQSIRPMRATTHLNIGNGFARTGQLAEAIFQYQQALEIQPRLALPHHNLGVVKMHRGELELAIAYFRRALQLQPDYPDAQRHLDQACAKREQDAAVAPGASGSTIP